MGYWLVMAIVAIAVVVVIIAVTAEDDEEAVRQHPARERPIWVAIGTNGRAPDDDQPSSAATWTDLVREAIGERAICYDFTHAGCTAEEAQRDQLAAAVATHPDVVSVLVGPDDFRDAEDLGAFERRLWHIFSTLRGLGARIVVGNLPDLTTLPSLLDEEDQDALHDELTSWNATIARLVSAVDGELIDVAGEGKDLPGDLFTESCSRFILTDAGQRWFATLMESRVKRLIGIDAAADATPDTGPVVDV